MSRSVIPRIRPRRRITVLASAGAAALAAAGALALTGTASAAPSAATGTKPSCSNATLNGTYTFGYISWSISNGKSTPASEAGFDTFNGNGTGTGVLTAVYNGVVAGSNTPDTSTYTINADSAGTRQLLSFSKATFAAASQSSTRSWPACPGPLSWPPRASPSPPPSASSAACWPPCTTIDASMWSSPP